MSCKSLKNLNLSWLLPVIRQNVGSKHFTNQNNLRISVSKTPLPKKTNNNLEEDKMNNITRYSRENFFFSCRFSNFLISFEKINKQVWMQGVTLENKDAPTTAAVTASLNLLDAMRTRFDYTHGMYKSNSSSVNKLVATDSTNQLFIYLQLNSIF